MSSHCECGIIHLEQMSMYALVGDDLLLQCGVMGLSSELLFHGARLLEWYE